MDNTKEKDKQDSKFFKYVHKNISSSDLNQNSLDEDLIYSFRYMKDDSKLNTINSKIFKINTLAPQENNFIDMLNESRLSKKQPEKNRLSTKSRADVTNELNTSNISFQENTFNKPSYLILNIKPETSEEDPVLANIRNDHQFNQNDDSLNSGLKTIPKKMINRKRIFIALSITIIALIIIFVIIMLSVAFSGKLI